MYNNIKSITLSIYLSTYQSIYLSINLSINYQSINLSMNQPIYQSINQHINQSIYQSINQSVYQSTNPSIFHQSINQSISQAPAIVSAPTTNQRLSPKLYEWRAPFAPLPLFVRLKDFPTSVAGSSVVESSVLGFPVPLVLRLAVPLPLVSIFSSLLAYRFSSLLPLLSSVLADVLF